MALTSALAVLLAIVDANALHRHALCEHHVSTFGRSSCSCTCLGELGGSLETGEVFALIEVERAAEALREHGAPPVFVCEYVEHSVAREERALHIDSNVLQRCHIAREHSIRAL